MSEDEDVRLGRVLQIVHQPVEYMIGNITVGDRVATRVAILV